MNYKKINNPCGTTSLLALNTPPPNIEYAGLTRFEIPFEIEEDTSQTNNSSDKVNDASPNKQAKIALENETKETKGDEMDLVAQNTPTSNDVFIENIQKSIMNFEENSNKEEQASKKSNSSESKIDPKEDQKEILDNLYETAAAAVKSFHSENSFEEAYSSKDLFNSGNPNTSGKTNQIVREPIESNVSSDYWTTGDPLSSDAKKDSLQKKTHLSHYDLENDPIINKDLQQLHSNMNSVPESTSMQHQSKAHLPAHYITNITSQPLITPSPTVCSVPSSVSSNASQFSLNSVPANKNVSTHNNPNNNLSINPSSTSSTSSTQMISPVSSEMGNMRSASIDQPHQYSNM